MMRFSATFGNIVLTIQVVAYKGSIETLPLSVEDRTDIEAELAGIFQLHTLAHKKDKPNFTIEFIEPFVVLSLGSDDPEITDEEFMMEEIALLFEDSFIAKVELHFELEERVSKVPPWAQTK